MLVANAVLPCVPTRIGSRAVLAHVRNRSRRTSASGASAVDHRCAVSEPHVFSSASSTSSHAQPYGRSQCLPQGPRKNSASTSHFSGVSNESSTATASAEPSRSGRNRTRRTASHVWWTHECQS